MEIRLNKLSNELSYAQLGHRKGLQIPPAKRCYALGCGATHWVVALRIGLLRDVHGRKQLHCYFFQLIKFSRFLLAQLSPCNHSIAHEQVFGVDYEIDYEDLNTKTQNPQCGYAPVSGYLE